MSATTEKKSVKTKLTKSAKLAQQLSPDNEKTEKKDKKNKKGDSKPSSPQNEEDVSIEEVEETPMKKSARTKDLSFKRLQLKDQILLRPDTYIGSVKKVKTGENFWVRSGEKFIQKSVSFTEGFLRLFIEVVSNAVDNVWRSHEFNIPCKYIKISIDKENHTFSCWNDGKTIPIEPHKDEKVYIPEMIFGTLLTSSNYDDSEERKTSGLNGMGSKCLEKGTIVPSFKGELKEIEEYRIGDKLIGPDGNSRTVLDVFFGKGKMYEITQPRGNKYVVNDQHILTLRMPDHKVIFWDSTNYCWAMLWWDHENQCIEGKRIYVEKKERVYINCKVDGCDKKYLSRSKLIKHYKIFHPTVEIPKSGKKPVKNPEMTNDIKEAREEMEEFAKTISDDNIIDISIQKYMKLNKTTKGRLSGFKGECVNWDKKDVLLDPYILGMWLGDGLSKGDGFAGEDNELIIKWVEWAKQNNCEIVHSGKYSFRIRSNLSKISKPSITETSNIECTGCKHKICTLCSDETFKNKYHTSIIRSKTNPLKEVLSYYNLIDNKHIPKDYLINDRETRLKLLAGFIDTDGTVSRDGTRIVISQGPDHEDLIEQLYFLVKSLGLSCYFSKRDVSYDYKNEKKYSYCFKLDITGKLDDIPTVLPRKKCRNSFRRETMNTGVISIKELTDEREYVGLKIDGDKRFILEDFTVTHNCTNIFSNHFSVECFNSDKGIYKQSWKNNMNEKSEYTIDTVKSHYPKTVEQGKNGYTKISFTPDLKRFDMTELDDDTLAVIEKYIIDVAMIVSRYNVKVIYNDNEIYMKDYKDYIKYYFSELPKEYMLLHSGENSCVVCPFEEFTQVSFVNGIYTKDGGVHVDAWCEALFRPVLNKLNEKVKNKKFDMRDIKKHFFIFVNSSLDKPHFDNQSKTRLNTPVPQIEVKTQVISKLLKWSFVESMKDTIKTKEMSVLKTETERKKNTVKVEGLDDANLAGKYGRSQECVLCITEGLSAKTYVVKGMKYGLFNKKGHDFIGVMPIRGKFLNVRNASVNSIIKNKEVKSIIQAIGLQHNTDYSQEKNRRMLRYGKVVIISDADSDGNHITGLLYNFFDVLFPTLVRSSDFFYFMRVPILKITERNKVLDFYFYKEAQKYIQEKKPKTINIRYFKGLGTSNNDDVKNDFGKRLVHVKCDSKESEEQINKIFSKDFTDYRKEWIAEYNSDNVNPSTDSQLDIKDFLNNELINFSIEDCKRSIPNILDGLKESQRKVLYSAIKKGLSYKSKSLKVAQFAGYIAEQTNYHHGEQNLYETITKMAQRFVGSNNIPILFNDGQFGERYENGDDAANGRYIFTKLDKLTRLMFREEDDEFLENIVEDGDVIEKRYYIPIVPVILINGNAGIGTGWSSHVCAYNVRELITWIQCWINKKDEDEFPKIKPYYNNFKGVIEEEGTRVKTRGVCKHKKDKEYVISEIPLGKKNMSISKYKESLETLKEEGVLTSINDQSSENEINFTVKISDELKNDENFDENMLMNKLGLEDTFSTNNMVLFDKKDGLKKYKNVDEILQYFCQERYELYKIRRAGVINNMKTNLKYLRNKEKFVTEVVNKKLVINDLDEDDVLVEMERRKYDRKEGKFEYLLTMQMRQMTKTKIEELQKEIEKCEKELEIYSKLSEKDLWRRELEELQKEL